MGQTRKILRKGRRRTRQKGGTDLPPIHIVYFTYFDTKGSAIKDARAGKLIAAQMRDLVECGLSEAAKSIHIVLSAVKESDFNNTTETRIDEVEDIIHSIIPKAEVHRSPGNRHEYPGIRRIWDLARKVPEGERAGTFMLYFHSKGMISGAKYADQIKSTENTTLTQTLIMPWKDIIGRFKADPPVNKIGYAAAKQGFCWYNFWWARASYIVGCPRPILTSERYYYESWLGERGQGATGGPGDTVSVCVDGPGTKAGVIVDQQMNQCKK
jgi:hypothetical protein